MKHNFENISKKTDNVRLTSAEKLGMLTNLREYAAANPAPEPSPYHSVWFRQMSMYATAFALVIGSGLTSYAAEDALPGDTLYGIKTNVNEGVVRILPLPTSAKAKVEITMIDRRMEELEKMIVTEIDTPEKVDVIMQKIEGHKEEFDTHLAVLTEDVRQEEVNEIHAELETVVDAHIAVLEEITVNEEPVADPTTESVTEPVVVPEPEPVVPADTADVPASDDMMATGPVTDDSSVTMMMQFKAAVPPVVDEVESVVATRTAPVKKVDPIVEEITRFSESKVKPFTQRVRGVGTTSLEIQEARTELRERIFRNAEKELNIDIEVSAGATGTPAADLDI